MEIVKIEAKELSLVDNNSLNAKQLALLLKKTPAKYIHSRPAKGGGTWDYVSGGYVRKVLNLMFGWDWDFEIISESLQGKQVIVKGRLTCRAQGRTIVKMQFGCKEVMYQRGTETPLNLGNDFKAAATDSLKKCAAELGIASDIYSKMDFNEVIVNTESIEKTNDLKETQRVMNYISSCDTIGMLETVKDTAYTLGLQTEYDAREVLINGK